jgi:hypothetical protein
MRFSLSERSPLRSLRTRSANFSLIATFYLHETSQTRSFKQTGSHPRFGRRLQGPEPPAIGGGPTVGLDDGTSDLPGRVERDKESRKIKGTHC